MPKAPILDLPSEYIFLSPSEIARMFRVGRTTIWRARQQGAFPEPVEVVPGVHRWRLSDVLAHFEAKTSQNKQEA